MKLKTLLVLLFVVVSLAFSVAPVHAAGLQDGIVAVDQQPNVSVSMFSWVLMHVLSVGGFVLAAVTAGVALWSNALQAANRQKERLAVIESLAKSAPPQIIDIVKALATQFTQAGNLAGQTGELLNKLTDDKVDYSLNSKSTSGGATSS